MIAALSSSSRFRHCYHLCRSHIAKRRSPETISWSFPGLFSYHLGIRRFRPCQGHARSEIVHGYCTTLHEALTSQARRELHRRCYHMIARSLARSLARFAFSFSSSLPPPTHLAIVRRNAHTSYETLFRDRQGRQN